MNGGNQNHSRQLAIQSRLLEILVPGLFTLILMACLAHMVCCALQAQCVPEKGFQYAISAFAL